MRSHLPTRSMRSIEDALREFLVNDLEVTPAPANDDALVDSGFVLSARLLELVGFIEDEFKIELKTRDVSAENMTSIATIASMIRARQAETKS